MSEPTTTIKRVTKRKILSKADQEQKSSVSVSNGPILIDTKDFSFLLEKITQAQKEFEDLQKVIQETKEAWLKEEKNHDFILSESDKREEVIRVREKEAYEYELSLSRKKEQDVWQDKKQKQEKELEERKEEIEKDKQELVLLRRQAATFEQEKEKAVKEAEGALQQSLNDQYAHERKLREQEIKSEKELSSLKIEGLVKENSRLFSEIILLKKSLEDATGQIKEIAVKVIEAGSAKGKPLPQEE